MSEYKYDVQGVRVRKSVERTIDGQLRRLELMVHSKYFVTEKQTLLDGSGLPGTKTAVNNVYLNGVRIASLNSNGLTKYYHANNVDSVKVVTDEAGAAISRTEYLPYGETFAREGDLTFAPKYNGQALDQESDLYFFNARHYDPEIARFVTADTVTDGPMTVKGWNRYMYVGGNPIMYKDPTGHTGESGLMGPSALSSGSREVLYPWEGKGGGGGGSGGVHNTTTSPSFTKNNNEACTFCHDTQGSIDARKDRFTIEQIKNRIDRSENHLLKMNGPKKPPSLSEYQGHCDHCRTDDPLFRQASEENKNNIKHISNEIYNDLFVEDWTDEDKVMAMSYLIPSTRVASYGMGFIRGFATKGGRTFSQLKSAYWAAKAKPTLQPLINPKTGQVWKQYTELHHRFIPQRAKWAPNWLKNNSLNLKQMSSLEHAIVDPYRARFAPKWVKDAYGLTWK